jgi:hypothetical protein
MKCFAAVPFLVLVVAVSGYAVDDISPSSKAPADKPRAVSQQSIAYLQRLRKNTPFGTTDFNLEQLRAGMGSRCEPTIEDVKLIRLKIGEMNCEWVLAPGADPGVRLLYLHGGGFVSGSGAYYLPLAAHISAAAKCAVLLPDYRLAPPPGSRIVSPLTSGLSRTARPILAPPRPRSLRGIRLAAT